VAVLAVGGLLAGLLVAFSDSDDSSTGSSVSEADDPASTAPSGPQDDDAEESDNEAFDPAPDLHLPAGSETFDGKSGWTMQTSPDWVKFDIPSFEEEAAWATGGGTAGFGNNINVLVEKPSITVDFATYVTLSEQTLDRLGAKILRTDTFAAKGHDYGRVEYLFTTSGVKTHDVAYVSRASEGWSVATYSAVPETFASESAKVEPYLATMQAR
jgi:hypothetical protein